MARGVSASGGCPVHWGKYAQCKKTFFRFFFTSKFFF